MSTGHYLEQLQLSEMMDGLDRLFAGYNWQLGGLFEKILSGNIKEACLLVYREVTGSLLHQLAGFRGILTAVLLLGILSVFVSGFIAGFENHQIADIAHYIFYLLLLAILLKLFSECYETALQTLSSLVLFSRLVLPALCLSAGPAAGAMTAAGYYELALGFIFLVENFLLQICLPLLPVLMLLLLMNGVWEEGQLESLMELLENGIRAACKFALSAVTGLGVIQSMVAPALDHLKRSGLQKAVSFIPALGGLAESTGELFIGSAVLVKNSLGLFALLLLILLLAPALWQLFGCALLLKIGGALIGIVADKRLSACVTRTADVLFLMLHLSGAGAGCFFILVTVITCLTGGG